MAAAYLGYRSASILWVLRGVLVLAATVLVAVVGPSLKASGRTLDQALVATYETNPSVLAARARLRGVNEGVPQELSNWRRHVSVNASVGRQRLKEAQRGLGDRIVTTTDYTNPVTAEAQVRRHPLYRGGRTIVGFEQARNEVKAQRAQLEETQQEVLLRAIEADLDLWRDRRIVRLSEDNVETLRRQLTATRARLERGIVTRTDPPQGRSRLSQARARLETARGDLTSSGAVYRGIVGTASGERRYPGVPPGLPRTREAAVVRAAIDNPQVVAAKFQEAAAQNPVRQTEGEIMPNVFLEGRVSYREDGAEPAREQERAARTLYMEVPLYQAGQVTSRLRQAKQEASERRLQIAATRRRTQQQATCAWARLSAARVRAREIDHQVQAARAVLRGVEQELQVGARTVRDVLDGERELVNAEVERVRARRDLVAAAYRRYKATGQLTARSLELKTGYHAPQNAYDQVRGTWWRVDAPQTGVIGQ